MPIHHLAFRTRRRAALVRFYRDVVGLPVVSETPRSAWLDAGAGTLVMIERRARAEPPVAPGSLELVAFTVTRAGRARVLARLARRRIPVEAETEFTSYFRDPDGRRVAVSHYPRLRKRRAQRRAM